MADEPLDLKRGFKAGFFASLFNDKERGLELVNAVMDADYPPGTEVTIETLSDVFFMGIQNDLALLVGNTVLFLGEHQSSINMNIPVRFISYYGRILESMVPRRLTYKPGTLKIARPVFVVLYNGIDPFPARQVLKLSSSFKEPDTQLEEESFVELRATAINIHSPENAELVSKSPYLSGYVEVVRRSREYQAQGLDVQSAVSLAIQDCIREGIIADYLRRHAPEVSGMLTEEFKLEDYLWARETGWKELGEQRGIEIGKEIGKEIGMEIGEAVGKEIGRANRTRDMARQLRDLNIDMNAIIATSGLSEEEILRL
ncbi:MAG: hypothetical protein LBH66_00945 [Oscillospiraceae bacterium]|nr:hypothetical protein [Oscillospiraceae bacterium]